MLRNRQQLRRWAARTLFVWLFGIASGVVQACLTPSAMAPGGRAFTSPARDQLVHDSAAAASGGRHHAPQPAPLEGVLGHEDSPGKSNCQDFCEKAAVAVTALKSPLDKVQGHALPAVEVAMTGLARVAEPVTPPAHRGDRATAPPIRLAFLRLAL